MNIYSCFLFFHVSPVAATTGLLSYFYFWGGYYAGSNNRQ